MYSGEADVMMCKRTNAITKNTHKATEVSRRSSWCTSDGALRRCGKGTAPP